MSRKKLTVYQRIMRAGKRETGLRLTYEDVLTLSLDPAIETTAGYDDFGHPEDDSTIFLKDKSCQK